MSDRSRYVFGAAAVAAALGGMGGFGPGNRAEAATAAFFAFENPTFASFAASTASYLADFSGTGTFSAFHAAQATFSQPGGNGNATAGAPASGTSHAFSSNNFAVGDYYQFNVPTTTLTGVVVRFDQTGSATGPGVFSLQYSTNGADFSVFTTYTLPFSTSSAVSAFNSAGNGNSALSFAFDLSSVPGLLNDPSAAFRVVDASTVAFNGTAAAASGGTDRIDNISVSDTPVPEPTGLALVSVVGSAAMLRRKRKVD